MKTFDELRKINVSEFIEKKNGLSYLSWSWAVDQLLLNDPKATWAFNEPANYGETLMVSCTVYAFEKTMQMHLPVMDNRNQAIKNPDAVAVNKAMMRCLAKCIACFGIALYIYSGEDLPSETLEDQDLENMVNGIKTANTLNELRDTFTFCYTACKKYPEALKAINEAKESRKKELENANT
jgi:hypothetical protein